MIVIVVAVVLLLEAFWAAPLIRRAVRSRYMLLGKRGARTGVARAFGC